MADNVVADAGAGGATFATDDVGGVHYPISKLAFGPLDTIHVVEDASTKRIPVKVAEALAAGTNNIGDVDVLTVPAPLSTTGGGTEATALRVTVASDSTGVLSIDDNGGSLTVDGSVSITGAVDTELPAAAALADAASAAPTTPTVGSIPLLMNATTVDRARAIRDALDSVGTGIQAVGIVGQFDDSGTSAVTENQFAAVRISSRRALLAEGGLNHDSSGSTVLPLAVGGFASAAAPADVSADTDIVRSWHLRNGAQATVITAAGALVGGDATNGLDVDVTRVQGTVAVTQSGTWTVQPGNTQNTTPWIVKEGRSGTGTRTQVSDTTTDSVILASNANRLGATVYNDSSALLYLGLGTTATSTTNYTARVYPNGYYEVPANYTGEIRGSWATDPNDGAARVTELT